MMETYTRFYGRYAELECRMANVRWAHCPECSKETLEFLINKEEHEVIGCTECMSTAPSGDEQYMKDTDEGTFLHCSCCGKLCDTLYAAKSTPYYVDGCENCLEWIDAYEEEE